jgi:hypothetical protein
MTRRFGRIPLIFIRFAKEKLLQIGHRSYNSEKIAEIEYHERHVGQKVNYRLVSTLSEQGKQDIFYVIVDGINKEINRDNKANETGERDKNIEDIEVPFKIEHQVKRDVFNKGNEVGPIERGRREKDIFVFTKPETHQGFIPTQPLFYQLSEGIWNAGLTNGCRLKVNLIL